MLTRFFAPAIQDDANRVVILFLTSGWISVPLILPNARNEPIEIQSEQWSLDPFV